MSIIFEKFGVKIFLAFATLIFFVSFSFAAHYIHHQSGFLTDTLIKDGRLLAGILAYNSRIGVFSENGALLENPIEGIFQHKDVLAVSVFTLKGELLKHRQKPGGISNGGSTDKTATVDSGIFEKLQSSQMGFHLEHKRYFEFWSPVLSGTGYTPSELLLFEKAPARKNRTIGFVKVTLDCRPLMQQINQLLSRSIIIGIAFLVIGSGLAYIAALSITRPLNRLTEGVRAFGRGGAVQKVSIETKDEIGKLAGAFNDMAEALKKREQALKESEKRLRLLSTQLLEAQEKERKRLAGELHDELGQSLALLKHRIRSVQRKLPEDLAPLSGECEETSRYIDRIIENVRRLSRDLRPSILENLGLSTALGWLIESFQQQYAIQTLVEMENVDGLFPEDGQTNIYRIFQEALTNIGKHAHASRVHFEVKKENNFILFRLKDDGKGFDLNEAKTGVMAERGMGLAAMQERSHMLGADLDIISHTGKGTTLALKIPLKEGGSA
jgi:signal transduction histidine kinase